MRKLLSLVLLLAPLSILSADPSLTTIQDVLFKADGTRFNGSITVNWNNFQAGDASIVATQSLTLQIVNGVLKVQLVPTTNASPGANYQVSYQSAGKYQFTETWAVPASSLPLRVRDVRVSSGTTVGTIPVTGGQLQISDITGLTSELLARPMRGAAFAPGRTAVINSAGQIDAAQGSVSDCVLVDGSSAPCGGSTNSSTNYSDAETPGGTVNGSNATFTLANSPQPPASLLLYRNGLLMTDSTTTASGTGGDYTLSGSTITFFAASVPQTGDLLTASYRWSSTGNIVGNQTAVNSPIVLCNAIGSTTAATSQQILGTCNIAANALAAGDRVEIKFGYTHQGTATGFNPAVYFGGTSLVVRAMNPSDSAIVGETNIMVASAGTFAHLTQSQGAGGLPVMTSGAVAGNIQNINTIAFNGSVTSTGTPDSLTLQYFSVTRYPAPQ